MADDFERGGSKLYAALARALADDPMVAAIVGDHEPLWEAPLRLFAGVHYLELSEPGSSRIEAKTNQLPVCGHDGSFNRLPRLRINDPRLDRVGRVIQGTAACI